MKTHGQSNLKPPHESHVSVSVVLERSGGRTVRAVTNYSQSHRQGRTSLIVSVKYDKEENPDEVQHSGLKLRALVNKGWEVSRRDYLKRAQRLYIYIYIYDVLSR